MTRSKGWLFAAMASTLVATIAGQEPPRFRSDVRTVVMYATVQGRDGRLVPNLSQDDFEILEDGQPRPIATFSSEPVPITATLMLDMSDSMRDYYERVREAARRFVDALQPGDRVRIGTFGHTAALSPFLTSDKAILHRVLNEELLTRPFKSHELGTLWPDVITKASVPDAERFGASPLWDNLDAVVRAIAQDPGRRAILILTDGRSTGNHISVHTLIEDATAFGVSIWPIEYGPSEWYVPDRDQRTTHPSHLLSQIATATGGRFASEPDRSDMSSMEAAFLSAYTVFQRDIVTILRALHE